MIDQPPAIVQILDDTGGALGERVTVTAWLRRIAVKVEVVGVCASACLWVLTLPKEQVCFAPGARIGEHHLDTDAVTWTTGAEEIAQGWNRCR